MRRTLATVLILGAAAVAVADAAKFKSTWKAPDAGTLGFGGKKVIALVISKDDALRMSAEEALARYAFDLVIVDIRMSGILGIEGLELLSYIKRYWPKTEVIVMTAHGSTEIKQEAYGRGARYYYQKPVDITELAERVRSMGIPVKG